jgi:selenide,water dikinase
MMTFNGRLTSLAHGGGCGCKIAPAVLSEILKSSPVRVLPSALLAGTENNEDAAVYQINENQAIVATTDFFMPIVDDPFEFGRIAATNAISDVYAMGAQPLFALALLGMPINVIPMEAIQKITQGGESICAQANIPIAGGHSIDTVEPIYGLVVIGIVDPKKLKRNSSAKAGDSIILGKPLGVGILSAALKSQTLSKSAYEEMISYTTQLNTPGIELSNMQGVHALTDVTGFGLAGHLLELSRGSHLNADIKMADVPIIPEASELVQQNIFTGASTRNWSGYSHEIDLDSGITDWQKNLLSDPQTSGGLLVSCDPSIEDQVLDIFVKHGFHSAAKIGAFHAGQIGKGLRVR